MPSSKFQRAIERADRRVEALTETGTGTVQLSDISLTCAGSDVYGPDLIEVVTGDALASAERVADEGHELPGEFAGAFMRAFWLGWEVRDGAD